MHLLPSVAIPPNLVLKTWPKQLLGTLSIVIALPGSPNNENIPLILLKLMVTLIFYPNYCVIFDECRLDNFLICYKGAMNFSRMEQSQMQKF
jgi:hypothetical protein